MLVKHLLFVSFRFQRGNVKKGVAKMQQSLEGLARLQHSCAAEDRSVLNG